MPKYGIKKKSQDFAPGYSKMIVPSAQTKKPVKPKAVVKPKPKPKRMMRKSHKDIQIVYLMNGAQAVRYMWNNNQVSRASLHRAMTELQGQNTNVASLEELVEEVAAPQTRGRKATKAGDRQAYKVQETGGAVFIRLPLGVLNVSKSDKVQVSFENDRIVVMK